ncbi:hypothetical protein QR98_0031470 [Sarcoptes scabiei]|uniref:Uncharacterized protein n=1 Tax=Sarcoptes scabiei TaxID=52283 RepID=A0A132A183_SARSC|nr:hypothetical protein QR98_0031470 [Sarcoptes scabiei]
MGLLADFDDIDDDDDELGDELDVSFDFVVDGFVEEPDLTGDDVVERFDGEDDKRDDGEDSIALKLVLALL